LSEYSLGNTAVFNNVFIKFEIEAGWVWLPAPAHTITQKLNDRDNLVIVGVGYGLAIDNTQNSSGAQPVSYPVDAECCLPVKKEEGARK
jgi:hypothetical protein